MSYQFRLTNWNEEGSPTRDRDARSLRYLLASNSSSSVAFNNRTGSSGTNDQVVPDNIMQNNSLHPTHIPLHSNITNTTTSHGTNNNHYSSPMILPTTINIRGHNGNQTSASSDSSPPRLFGSPLTLVPTTRRSTPRYINTTRQPSSMYPSITQLGTAPSNYHQVQSREGNNNNGSATSLSNGGNHNDGASAIVTSTGTDNASFKRSRSPNFVRGESSNQGSQEGGTLRRRTNPPPTSFQQESVNNNNMFSMPSTPLSTRYNNNNNNAFSSMLQQQANQYGISVTQNSITSESRIINPHLEHASPAGFFDDTPSYNSLTQPIIDEDVARFLFPYQQETHRASFTMPWRTELVYASTFVASLYPSAMTRGITLAALRTSSFQRNNNFLSSGASSSSSSRSLGWGYNRIDSNHIFTSTSLELMAQRNRLRDEVFSFIQHLHTGGFVHIEDLVILDYSIVLNVLDYQELMEMLHNIDYWPYEVISTLEEDVERIETGLTEEEILTYIETETHVLNPNETSTQNKTCTICQEDYMEGEIIGRLDCRHIYHLECIKQWLLLKNVCPICKKIALEVDEDEDESD